MQVLVGIGHRVAILQQLGGQILGGVGVAAVGESLVDGLVPDVEDLGAIGSEPFSMKRLGLECIADVDGEGRHEVFAEVLVLVVAPYEDEVRVEVVDLLAEGAEG